MPTLDERIEAAERLAQELETAGYDNGLMNDTAAALIRAQAAEIARHPAALQEARNAALREAANIVRGEVYLKHYRTWVIWPPYDDLTRERPNVSENHGKARHCDQLADAILTLIDTPAPPADPAGDALRELREAAADVLAQVAFVPVKHPGHTHQRDRLRAALAAAPAPQPEKIMCSRCDGSGYAWAVGNCPDCNGDGWVNAPIQPAPQPDADEREALVVAMSKVIRDNIDIEWAEAKTAADALLAAGWTRK